MRVLSGNGNLREKPPCGAACDEELDLLGYEVFGPQCDKCQALAWQFKKWLKNGELECIVGPSLDRVEVVRTAGPCWIVRAKDGTWWKPICEVVFLRKENADVR